MRTNSSKAELQAYLDRQKERFTGLYGGEIVRYAAPEECPKIKLGAYHPIPNLVEEEYQKYLKEVEEGTYAPDTNYQEKWVRPARQKNVRLDDFNF